jgi:hypothetical protein
MRNCETVEVLEGTGGREWEELWAVINRIPLCKCLRFFLLRIICPELSVKSIWLGGVLDGSKGGGIITLFK